MTPKPRARALGLGFTGEPGPFNAITDVPGVMVGSTTLIEDGELPLQIGRGPVRTGVTAILPRGKSTELMPVWAGVSAFNGNGEMTGTHWIEDGGYFNGPICLTNTHSVGMVHHGAVRWMIRQYPRFQTDHLWAMPVVAETYDGTVNDINGLHVQEQHVLAALDNAAGGPVAEGSVGGGAGMIAYEFKAGTGTASRRVRAAGRSGVVAALVQANHGRRDWLTVLGVPVGRHLRNDLLRPRELGSIIVVLATDLPLLPHQLRRLAKRGAIGIGRGGTIGGNSSGDLFLAFSTANPLPLPGRAPPIWQLEALDDDHVDTVYEAAIDSTEEAVINAMLAAEDSVAVRPAGKIVRAIDHQALMDVIRRYRPET